jgi:citrate synthase
MADKPSKGLADIIAASTALSDIDGRAGLLFYRGYDIHQLAGSATFEEIAYLLQRGHPPTRVELASYADEIAAGRALGSLVTACLPDVAGRQSPMEAMRSLVSLASADDLDKDSNAAGANIRKAARLVAQQDGGSPRHPSPPDVGGTRPGERRRHLLSDVPADGGDRPGGKGLYPNVDFFAATVYHYLQIPTDLFTPVFSVSRMAGWTAHIMEQHADNRLIRPDSEYIGERGLGWTPLDER